jgi:outer membrane protein assembly factor BamB
MHTPLRSTLVALIVAGALVAQPLSALAFGGIGGQALADAPWPMRGHDVRHSHRSTYTGASSPSGKWTFPVTKQTGVYSSPAVGADGTVYFGGTDTYLYAVRADHRLKWKFPTASAIYSSPALGADGTVYVGSDDSKVYAVNADGVKKWSFLTGGGVRSSPAIGTDGTIYVGSYDGKVYALDPANGAKKWESVTGGAIFSSPAIATDGTIYVGSRDHNVYALNPSDGTKKWQHPTGDEIFSSPAVATDGTIYVGSLDHNVYALNPADGTEKWHYSTGGAVYSSPAIALDGTVYIGSLDFNVYALDPTDGAKKWEFTTGGEVRASALVGGDGTIYIGSTGYLTDATGHASWVSSTSYGKLYALGSDGVRGWEYSAGNSIRSSAALAADGSVYFGGDDAKLHVIVIKKATTLTASTRNTRVRKGRSVVIHGVLLPGRVGDRVSVQLRRPGSHTWRTVGTARVTAVSTLDGGGVLQRSIKLTRKGTNRLRLRFPGESTRFGSYSGVLSVRVR